MVKYLSKSVSQSYSAQKLLAICGIVGPILYAIVVITVGFLRPNYNPITQPMSELGEVGGPNSIVMNIAGFIMLGLLMVAFAFGLHRGISEGKGSKIGPALIVIAGAGSVAIGIFSYDPSCLTICPRIIMHVISVMVLGIGMAVAPFAIANRLKHDQRWRGYRFYSLATGVLTVIVGFVFFSNTIEGWMGLLQRIALGVPLLWIEVMAIKLLRLSTR